MQKQAVLAITSVVSNNNGEAVIILAPNGFGLTALTYSGGKTPRLLQQYGAPSITVLDAILTDGTVSATLEFHKEGDMVMDGEEVVKNTTGEPILYKTTGWKPIGEMTLSLSPMAKQFRMAAAFGMGMPNMGQPQMAQQPMIQQQQQPVPQNQPFNIQPDERQSNGEGDTPEATKSPKKAANQKA